MCAVRRMSEKLMSVSLPAHDSRSCSITQRFSAMTSRMPSGTLARHRHAVDPPVLHALRARRPRDGDAARLEVQHRAALGGAHQALGPGAAGEAHLEAARGVAGGEEGLRPRRVVAVHEDLLRAVDRDRLGVRRQPAQPELELRPLLDRALRERAGRGHLRAHQQRQGVGRRVAQHGDGRLQLAEAERHGRGRVGREQQRMVDAVGHVRLDRRRPPHAHLGHRRQQLDGREQRQHLGDAGRRHAAHQARELGAGDVRVDEHAGELQRLERHRLLGDVDVDPVAGDELVDEVEVGLGAPVELDDPPVAHHQRGGRVVGTGERDQAELGVLRHEVVAADGARREVRRAQRRCLLLHGVSVPAGRYGVQASRRCHPPAAVHVVRRPLVAGRPVGERAAGGRRCRMVPLPC